MYSSSILPSVVFLFRKSGMLRGLFIHELQRKKFTIKKLFWNVHLTACQETQNNYAK